MQAFASDGVEDVALPVADAKQQAMVKSNAHHQHVLTHACGLLDTPPGSDRAGS
jgi:hypothetical protein